MLKQLLEMKSNSLKWLISLKGDEKLDDSL